MDPVDSGLVEAARKIGPVLRAHSQQAERERRLPKPVFEALAAAGLQSMFTPKSLGGLEVDPVTAARAIEEVASHDSAAGWALQAGNTGAWWCARLPQESAREIFGSNPAVLVSAAFHPPQRAIATAGGYRLTGRGPLASNVHDSDWLLLTAIVHEGDHPRMIDGEPDFIALAFPTREAQVIDTWDSLGLRGSDSNDVAVEDLFVPESRTFRLRPDFEPNAHYSGPLYRFPGIGEVGLIGAAVLLAIGRGAIDALEDLARRKTPFGTMKTLRDRSAVQEQVARADATLRAARLLFYDALRTTWERTVAGRPHSLEDRAALLQANVHAVDSAAAVTVAMHGLAGTSGIYTRNPLERYLRDAQTLRHHGFVAATRYETVGQIRLGLPPEFGLVAF